MTRLVVGYLLYLALASAVTVFVGRTLHRHGRLFLHDVFPGQDALADAVNYLLLIGFYLVNMALVLLTVRSRVALPDALAVATFVADKLGGMLLLIGGMHFLNVALLSACRRRARSAPAELMAFVD